MSLQGIEYVAQNEASADALMPDLLWAVAVAAGLLPVVGFYLLFLG